MSEHTDHCVICRRAGVHLEQPNPAPATATSISAHDVALDIINIWRARRPKAIKTIDQAAALIAHRKQIGLDRYGTILHTDDGRNHWRDLVEELADAAAYAAALTANNQLSRLFVDDIVNVLFDILDEANHAGPIWD